MVFSTEVLLNSNIYTKCAFKWFGNIKIYKMLALAIYKTKYCSENWFKQWTSVRVYGCVCVSVARCIAFSLGSFPLPAAKKSLQFK